MLVESPYNILIACTNYFTIKMSFRKIQLKKGTITYSGKSVLEEEGFVNKYTILS